MGQAVLIENGEVYSPEPRGPLSVLVLGGQIAALGRIDRQALDRLGIEYDCLDASGCKVIPGLIDPHEHLIGGSGEKGFATLTPEITLSELVQAGITTVVGCLGVDTTSRTMTALLAKAKGLSEEGLSAYVYSGGYDVPPKTLTGSVRSDMMLVSEVIGAGEIAISDRRGAQPTLPELARLVSDAYVGGLLAKKSGVTLFHVGEGSEGLALLRSLLDEYPISPELLYPTHVERNEELMSEAIALTRRGAMIDVDTMEEDLVKWVGFYVDQGGDLKHLTVSSDAAISSPRTLFDQIRQCFFESKLPMETVLSLVTANPARVLGLRHKGLVSVGCDGDLAVVTSKDFELRHVIARGRTLLRDGNVICSPACMKESNRKVELYGKKKTNSNP